MVVLLVIIGFVFYSKPVNHQEEDKIMLEKPIQSAQGRKVAMILAFEKFKDEEYFIPREILEKAGIQISVVSSLSGLARGVDGGEAQVDVLLNQLEAEEYDGVIFVGGPGAFGYLDDSEAHRVAQAAVRADKVLGAICIGPAILAKAGVLAGKKATVWSSHLDKSAIKILEENGALYQDKDVVVDGRIITASGPQAAEKFGQAMVQALTQHQNLYPK